MNILTNIRTYTRHKSEHSGSNRVKIPLRNDSGESPPGKACADARSKPPYAPCYTPPAEASEFLNAPEGARLLCLERLRGRPNLPFVYFISYFNPAIPMTGEEDMALPLYENLRKNYGIVVKTSREMVYARSANAELAEKLDINEGEPILVRKRFVLDVNDTPVEYNIGYYRADSFTYSIEFING